MVIICQYIQVFEVSADSLVWVSNRIGPVHTSMYITKNLLKMLMLCYSDSSQNDDKAIMVINCLINIAGKTDHTYFHKIK